MITPSLKQCFKIIKTEVINSTIFPCQQALYLELLDYVHWFNNIRIHGKLKVLNDITSSIGEKNDHFLYPVVFLPTKFKNLISQHFS